MNKTDKLVIFLLDVTASTPGAGIYWVCEDLGLPWGVASRAVTAYRQTPHYCDYGHGTRVSYRLSCAHAAEMLRRVRK